MKPWVVLNAQNRVIGRYVNEGQAIAAHRHLFDIGMVTTQYRPRKKRKPGRTFP